MVRVTKAKGSLLLPFFSSQRVCIPVCVYVRIKNEMTEGARVSRGARLSGPGIEENGELFLLLLCLFFTFL